MGCNCGKSVIYNDNLTEMKEETNDKLKLKTKCKNNKIKIEPYGPNEASIYKNEFLENIDKSETYELLTNFKLEDYLTKEVMDSYITYNENSDKFLKKFNQVENEEDEEETLNSNLEKENMEIKTFKMPPLKNKKENYIYNGEFTCNPNNSEDNNKFILAGNGLLINKNKELIIIKDQMNYNINILKNTVKFLNNGDIYLGSLMNKEPYEKINGVLFKNKEHDIESYIECSNFGKSKLKIKKHFSDNTFYDGEAIEINDKIILDGKGVLFDKKNKIVYKGFFKNNQYNGKGKLFKSNLSITNEYDDNKAGQTIISNFINGKPNGNSVVQTKASEDCQIKETKCKYRLGKLIQSEVVLCNKIHFLNKNILYFLSPEENYNNIKNIPCKATKEYLLNNNKFYLKLYKKLGDFFNVNSEYKSNTINSLLLNSIKNIDNLKYNIKNNNNFYIPIIGLYTNGGEVDISYRCFNLFNPNFLKIYCSNYLHNKCEDITIKGILNLNLDKSIGLNKSSYLIQGELEETEIKTYIHKYIDLYNKFETKTYPVIDKYNDIIDYSSYILKKEVIGDIKNTLFSIHNISIYVPKRVTEYNVLFNPCSYLCIYINNSENEVTSDEFIEISNSILSKNNYNILALVKNTDYINYIIKSEDNEDYSYVEFDTYKQSINYKNKLLAIVNLKNINNENEPYILNFKKYYHIGNNVIVKLIKQRNIYNVKTYGKQNKEKGYSIDFGTINFFGDFVSLK